MYKSILLLATLFTLVGCQVALTPNTKSDGGGLDLTKAGAVIKNLQLGTITLPKSLQDGSTNPEAQESRGPARALGDTTTLTSLNMPSLKASGYQNFRQTIDGKSIVKVFLDSLKTVPSIADGSLPTNTTIDTGTIAIALSYGPPMTLTNSGKLSTALSSGGTTLRIFWNLMYPDSSQKPAVNPEEPYTSAQDSLLRAPRTLIQMYFIVQKSGQVEFYAYRPKTVAGEFMNFWSRFSPETGENVEAQFSNWGGGESTYLSTVTPQPQGGYSIFRSSKSSSWNSLSLGYADDNFGGVVDTGSSTYTDSSGVSASHPYINVEYYDGTGDLIYQGWGDSGRNSSNWDWRFSQAYNTNIQPVVGTKPDGFKVRTVWSNSGTKVELLVAGESDWKVLPAATGSFVFHDPTKDSGTWNIQEGDAQYSTSSNSYSWDAENSAWVWEAEYFKSYEVPAGELYFGDKYYVNKTYPLKNLLPLKAQYALGFEVTQKEGTTYYNWRKVGTSGWGYGTTPPSEGDYEPNSLYHWTNYEYWLENKNYLNSDGVNDNSPTVMEYDKGDVSLWLNNMQVYSWNSAMGQPVMSEAPAYSTYNSELPPYFGLSQSKKEAVEATKAKLEAIYAQRDNMTVDQYLEGYAGRIGSALPQFPDMAGYPGFLTP